MRTSSYAIRAAAVAGAMVIGAASAAWAAPGDQTILKIDHTTFGPFTPVPGGGYNGDPAYEHSGTQGDSSRVYWLVPNTVDPSPQLYKIDWWTTASGNAYQPFEVSVDAGVDGNDTNTPWHGQFNLNHQWITNNDNGGSYTTGVWRATGPGPQTPGDQYDDGTGESNPSAPSNPAAADGNEVWLKPGSEIWVKWDFPWQIDNVLSDIRITQVTGAPEPGTLTLLSLGGLCFLRRRRRA